VIPSAHVVALLLALLEPARLSVFTRLLALLEKLLAALPGRLGSVVVVVVGPNKQPQVEQVEQRLLLPLLTRPGFRHFLAQRCATQPRNASRR
jgi:hypothetical protein